MESLMNIFDFNKIESYVKILDKRADLKVDEIKKEYDIKFINEKIIPFTSEFIKNKQDDIFKQFNPKLKEECGIFNLKVIFK